MSLALISAQHNIQCCGSILLHCVEAFVRGAAWLDGLVAGSWVVTGRRNGATNAASSSAYQRLSLKMATHSQWSLPMHAHNGANIQPTLSEQCPTCNKGYRTMSACTYVLLRLRQPGHALSTYCDARFCAPTMLLYIYGYACMARSCRATGLTI